MRAQKDRNYFPQKRFYHPIYWPRLLLAGMIRGYQVLISPLLSARCRYYPTCSEYTREAVFRYGVMKGGWLGIHRLARCHPWGAGGYDPLP